MYSSQLRYFKTDKGKEAMKEAQKRYFKTDKGKEAQKRYFESDRGKEALKKAQRRQQEKQALVNSVKAKGCSVCGYNEHFCALDLHHTAGRDHTTQPINLGWKRLIDELINNCVVLCANCHRVEHLGAD